MEKNEFLEISRFIPGDYARAIYDNPDNYFDKDFCKSRGEFAIDGNKIRRTDKSISIMGTLEQVDQVQAVGIIINLPNFIDKAIAKFMHNQPRGKINISVYKVPKYEDDTETKEPTKALKTMLLGETAIKEQIIS